MGKDTDKRWKGAVIDYAEIAAMDAVDYEFKALNQQQVAILLMLLQYQKWETRWENLGLSKAELQRFIGDIEYRLMRNEVFMATQEEMTAAICAGLECFTEGAFKRYLSGSKVSFSVNEDGEIVVGGADADAGNLPENDPATPIDETESSRYGAIFEIAAKLQAVLDRLDTWYGATNGSPIDFEATAQEKMATYFPVDRALMDAAITAYYSYRTTQPRILFNWTAAFPQYLYCNGYDINALGRWLIDVSGYVITKQFIVRDLWAALADTFFSQYFAVGALKPNSSYLDAACVPIAYQEFTGMQFAVARTTTPFKALHRMKFRISGYALDTGGDIQDAFWYRTAAGVLTRSNWTFTHSAGSNQPSDNQVVYNSAHVYEYTIDLQNLNQVMVITPNKNAGMDAVGLTYPTPFKVEITDLGLAVS